MYPQSTSLGVTQEKYDAGLRSFMQGIYAKMMVALLLTAGLAFLSTQQPVAGLIHGVGEDGKPSLTIAGMVCAFGPLALILGLGLTGLTRTVQGSYAALFGVAALFGLSLGSLFFVYTSASLALTFVVTSGAFAGLSLFGYMTKMNLNMVGTFCFFALFGLIIAMVANIFVQSTQFDFIITIAGILIFAGLTAWDTQKAKLAYDGPDADPSRMTVESNNAALSLYLDFINMFLFLLKLLGQKK